jgi:hypothetical protein
MANWTKETIMPKAKKPDRTGDKTDRKKEERAPPSDRDDASRDKVDEAEEESFPASDPPAY